MEPTVTTLMGIYLVECMSVAMHVKIEAIIIMDCWVQCMRIILYTLQWNLLIRTLLGPAIILSFVERLSSFRDDSRWPTPPPPPPTHTHTHVYREVHVLHLDCPLSEAVPGSIFHIQMNPPIKDTPKEDRPPNKGQAESTLVHTLE